MSASFELCSFRLDEHLFGLDALEVQEIIPAQRITRVPLASPALAGLLNVRGELVTAIDLRQRLGLRPANVAAGGMNIVLRTDEEAVSLLVDSVGEVVRATLEDCEAAPPTLHGPIRAVTQAVVKLRDALLLRLSTSAIIAQLNQTEFREI